MAEHACDHHIGPVTGIAHGLRCWSCELRVPVGWRWQVHTVGDGLRRFRDTPEGVLLALAGGRVGVPASGDVPPIKVVVDYGQSAAQMAEGVGDG